MTEPEAEDTMWNEPPGPALAELEELRRAQDQAEWDRELELYPYPTEADIQCKLLLDEPLEIEVWTEIHFDEPRGLACEQPGTCLPAHDADIPKHREYFAQPEMEAGNDAQPRQSQASSGRPGEMRHAQACTPPDRSSR